MRIELENLSKRFDDGSDVLKDLHFADEVHTLAIIGSSGCSSLVCTVRIMPRHTKTGWAV